MPYTVTIRLGSKVTRRRVPSLPEAVDLLEMELRALGPAARRAPAWALSREIAPVAQVAA
ncbi:MAG: hypothetical protein QOJ63_1361, partial [Solirubrobacteraceae bacterium]|nr:hypothetical protein [Solirubrobacteraceae bacterium]